MDGDDVEVTIDNGSRITVAGNQVIQGSFSFEEDPIDKAINDLKNNFNFSDFHEERVRKLFENDNSLIDDLNHLVIAASVMISDAAQMKSGNLRAHEMGDKIIVEEKTDDEWKVVRTLGVQVAQILAHARAKKRVEELEDLVGGLGTDSTDRIFDLDEPDNNPVEWGDPWGEEPGSLETWGKEPGNSPFSDLMWTDNHSYDWGKDKSSTVSFESPDEMQEEIDRLKGDTTDALRYSLME